MCVSMARGSTVGFLAVMVTGITKKLLYLYQLVPLPPMQGISSHSTHSLSTLDIWLSFSILQNWWPKVVTGANCCYTLLSVTQLLASPPFFLMTGTEICLLYPGDSGLWGKFWISPSVAPPLQAPPGSSPAASGSSQEWEGETHRQTHLLHLGVITSWRKDRGEGLLSVEPGTI